MNSYYPFTQTPRVSVPSGGTDFKASQGQSPVNDIGSLIEASSLKEGDPNFKQTVNTALGQDVLSPTNLLPGQHALDSTTQGLISQYGENAKNTGANFTPQMLSGTDKAERFLPHGGEDGYHPAPETDSTGMHNPSDLSQALYQRGKQSFDSSMGALKSNLDFQAPTQEASKLGTYGSLLNANAQIQNQNYQAQVQYQNQQLALYNQWVMAQTFAGSQVLGQVIGAGGQVAGQVASGLAGGGAAVGAGAAGAATGVEAGLAAGLAA